jgi:hypothetical protein
MVRKFLYIVAAIVVLLVAAVFVLRIWADDLTELAFVPTTGFVEQDPLAGNAYQDPAMWFSRPGPGAPKDPARWRPAGVPRLSTDAQAKFAVFFVHPTSYLDRAHWNAALDDKESQQLARTYLRGMASPFNRASEIWAPRYRQATFGAFLTDAPEAKQAIDAAYRDVSQAFDYFLDSIDEDTPIVLAGHSQGSLHLLRLLRERVAGTELQKRIAMVYAIGWPISVDHDLPTLGLPACATPQQAGCIVGWSSFAEPAEADDWLEIYRQSPGFDGKPRGEDPVLCVNPITGMLGGAASATANLGTLVPEEDLSGGELVPGAVPARCAADGLLLIGDPPEMGPGVLPGNNYHVYDIPLFWRNLQEDVTRRIAAWSAGR